MTEIFKKETKAFNEKQYNVVEDLKEKANDVWKVIESFSMNNSTDPRKIALFRTNLEQAIMWATSALEEIIK